MNKYWDTLFRRSLPSIVSIIAILCLYFFAVLPCNFFYNDSSIHGVQCSNGLDPGFFQFIWYAYPLANLLFGIILYFVARKEDPLMAQGFLIMAVVGTVVSLVSCSGIISVLPDPWTG